MGGRVLVADGSPIIQKELARLLETEGIEVVTTSDGKHALEKALDMRPDLVLADIFLPVTDGYAVCELMKSSEKLSHVPVILLVGKTSPFDENRARKAGAVGYLEKSFSETSSINAALSAVKQQLERVFGKKWPHGRMSHDEMLWDEGEESENYFPTAFSTPFYKPRGHRNYLLVIRLSDNHLERVVQGPPAAKVNQSRVQSTLKRKLFELTNQYPLPEYDVAFGLGELRTLKSALPLVVGWEKVQLEELKVEE